MGGVLFIDEAYYLYRPDNERDYGQEAIEILLQVMENQRDDLVVILAGYADRMERFYQSNPGFRSRIAHHIDFPDYEDGELLTIAETMLHRQNYCFDAEAQLAHGRIHQPAAGAAAFRQCALDPQRPRPRPARQANRLFETSRGAVTATELSTIRSEDIRASRVFATAVGNEGNNHG